MAQELMLGQTGVYSNVDIKAAAGVTPDELKARVQAAVGDGYKVLGTVLGTALGITLIKIFGGDFLKLTIPWGYLIITLIAAIIAGRLAALLPAIRAARLNVLEAISYE